MPYNDPSEDKKANRKRLLELIESDNIAELLYKDDPDKLYQIGENVRTQFDIDDGNGKRQEKVKKWKDAKKIAEQIIEQKNVPYDNSSNVKYPLLTVAAIQFNARSYPAIVEGNSVVKPKFFGKTSSDFSDEDLQGVQQQAQQIQQVQPTNDIEKQQQFNMLQQLAEQGEQMSQEIQQFKEKQEKGDRASDYMNWQLFNEDDTWEDDTDNLLLRVSLYGEMYRKVWHSKGKIRSKILSPEDFVVPNSARNIKSSPRTTEKFTLFAHEIEEKIRNGVYMDFLYELDDDEPLEFLEQHRREDLDDDGYSEPYIVIVETKNNNVVRIQANYTEESIIGSKVVTEIIPQQYYIKYAFIPSMDGSFLCTGLYDILFPINDAVNTAINMLFDSGKLKNSPPGFIDNGMKLAKGGSGILKYKIGQFMKVNTATGRSVRDSVHTLDMGGPSDVLFNVLGMLIEAGREIAGTQEALMGQQSVNASPTTLIATIEQGLKVFSGIYKRIHRSLGEELRLRMTWNNKILDSDQYQNVIDEKVDASDFSGESFDFTPVSDATVVTDMQKMAKAQYLQQFLNDPYFNQMLIRRKLLDAAAIPDVDDLLVESSTMQEQMKQLELSIQQQEGQNRSQELAIEMKKLEQKDRELNMDAPVKDATALEKQANAMSKFAEIPRAERKLNLDETNQILEEIENERNFYLNRQRDLSSVAGPR